MWYVGMLEEPPTEPPNWTFSKKLPIELPVRPLIWIFFDQFLFWRVFEEFFMG